MKKILLGIVTTMLLVAMMLPISVQAATLELEKTEMKVENTVDVTVTLDVPAEEFQFDLKFDNKVFQYVNGSAKSELSSTGSNLIAPDVVRVSAFDINGKTTKKVTLQFEAIKTGENVPFSIVGNTAEVNGVQETFSGKPILVQKVGENPNSNRQGGGAQGGSPQYVGEGGQPILTLPQTGDELKAVRNKSVSGMYKKMITGETVVPYALPNCDTPLTIEDVKAEFGSAITGLTSDPVKTGDSFDTNTIIIYGDVNGDGKVTTFDALTIRKTEKGDVTLDKYKTEAADVKNDGVIDIDDAYAVQNFVLGLRVTNTDTVIDTYPKEDVSISAQEMGGITSYRFTDITFAMVTSSSADTPINSKNELGFIVDKAPNGVNKDSVKIDYNESTPGSFEIVLLNAPASGEYTITPTINGNKIEGGQKKGNPVSVTVDELYTVTDIELTGEGIDTATGNVNMKAGKTINPTMTFLHIYRDANNKELGRIVIPENVLDLTASNVKLTFVDNSANALNSTTTNLMNVDKEPVVLDASGNPVSGAGKLITSLRINAVNKGNAKIKLSLNNSNQYVGTPAYVATYEKEISIDVADKARTTEVLYKGRSVQSIDIPMYTFDPSNKNEVVESGGLYYTVLPLTLKDEDGVENKISNLDISKKEADGKPIVLQENNSKSSLHMATIGLLASEKPDGNGGFVTEYTAITNASLDVQVDAVGVAFANPISDTSYNKVVSGGISLNYNGLESNNIVRKTIPITVSLQTTPITTELDVLNNAPQTEQNSQANKLPETNKTASVANVDIVAPVVKDNELDYTNAKLVITMTDGTKKEIALTKDMVTLSEYDKDSSEKQEVVGTVTYEGKTYKFTVIFEAKVDEKPAGDADTVVPDTSKDVDENETGDEATTPDDINGKPIENETDSTSSMGNFPESEQASVAEI